jgi:hypothetical protein
VFELKPLPPAAIPAALEKAVRYRLLNEPEQAESICHDVLLVEPDNQEALTTLILALTDRLLGARPVVPRVAQNLLPQLKKPFEREYYAGVIAERAGVALLRSTTPHSGADVYAWFRQAMIHYEKADALGPPANADPRLRWNSCARMIMSNPQVAPDDDDAGATSDLGE